MTVPSFQLKSVAFALAASESLMPEYHRRLRVALSLSVIALSTKISSWSLLIAVNSFFCLRGGNTCSIRLTGSLLVECNHLESVLMTL
jgi:hypothetical protein